MKFLKTVATLLVIVAIFGVLCFALNFITGPIIAENNKGEFGNDVLLYSVDEPGTLKDVAPQVVAIYDRDAGFAIQCKTIGNYEKAPIELTVLVSDDGKITELKITNYTDSINVNDKDANFIPSFVGKDSALADVNLVAGCTYSSKSIKEAVEAGLNVLISNDLIAAGVKSDAQLLLELIPTVFPAMGTPEDAGVAVGNITAAYKTASGVGYAYIVKDGETSVLVLVNNTGAAVAYDTTGADVTEAKSAQVSEAVSHFDTVKADYSNANSKFTAMIPGAGEMTPVTLNSFNTLVYGAKFEAEGKTYYGYYSRVIGFEQMEVYVVLDADGKIAKIDAAEFIFHQEYFGTLDPKYNKADYVAGFVGLENTDSAPVIGGATMTSNAVKTAVNDAIAAFNSAKGGEQ